jgi:hypothetical protein
MPLAGLLSCDSLFLQRLRCFVSLHYGVELLHYLFFIPVSEGQILGNKNYHGLRARFLRARNRKLPNVLIFKGLENLAERGGFEPPIEVLAPITV